MGMSTIRRTSARKAVEEASRSFRRALKPWRMSSCTINCTRENSAIRVLANVLSKSLIRPKSRMDRSRRAWTWSRMELAICRVRSFVGAASVPPSPVLELLEGKAPASVGCEAACSRMRLCSSKVEGNTVSNAIVQWSCDEAQRLILIGGCGPNSWGTVSSSYGIRLEASPPSNRGETMLRTLSPSGGRTHTVCSLNPLNESGGTHVSMLPRTSVSHTSRRTGCSSATGKNSLASEA